MPVISKERRFNRFSNWKSPYTSLHFIILYFTAVAVTADAVVVAVDYHELKACCVFYSTPFQWP